MMKEKANLKIQKKKECCHEVETFSVKKED